MNKEIPFDANGECWIVKTEDGSDVLARDAEAPDLPPMPFIFMEERAAQGFSASIAEKGETLVTHTGKFHKIYDEIKARRYPHVLVWVDARNGLVFDTLIDGKLANGDTPPWEEPQITVGDLVGDLNK